MKTRMGILLVVLLLVSAVSFSDESSGGSEITISIVFDRNLINPELDGWEGFGCVVATPKVNILFDTGYGSRAGEILLSNMEKMNIDPLDIDIVVISHSHLTAGLSAFLKENPDVTVYGPETMDYGIIVEKYGAQYRELAKFTKLAKNVYSTGGFRSKTGSTMEQSLVIDAEPGLVVVCGCAHPGIINVLERVKSDLPNRNFHLVMGGFHLENTFAKEREQILQRFIELGVQKVCPCHCSGRFREIAEREYKENYIEGGVGQIIVVR